MRRHTLLLPMIATAMIGSGPLQADTKASTLAALDRFVMLCNRVMADPSAYIAGLAENHPDGTFGIIETPDGQHLKVNVSIGGGKYLDTYSKSLLNGNGSEGCGTYTTGSLKGDGSEIAKIVESFFEDTVGADQFSGGYFPELYSEWGDTSDRLILNPNGYSYSVAGLLDDPELETFVHAANDFLSFTTFRDLKADKN